TTQRGKDQSGSEESLQPPTGPHSLEGGSYSAKWWRIEEERMHGVRWLGVAWKLLVPAAHFFGYIALWFVFSKRVLSLGHLSPFTCLATLLLGVVTVKILDEEPREMRSYGVGDRKDDRAGHIKFHAGAVAEDHGRILTNVDQGLDAEVPTDYGV